jgi:hypothetical protein
MSSSSEIRERTTVSDACLYLVLGLVQYHSIYMCVYVLLLRAGLSCEGWTWASTQLNTDTIYIDHTAPVSPFAMLCYVMHYYCCYTAHCTQILALLLQIVQSAHASTTRVLHKQLCSGMSASYTSTSYHQLLIHSVTVHTLLWFPNTVQSATPEP